MIKSIRQLFRRPSKPVVVGEMVALEKGELQTHSLTWAFIRNHCIESVNRLREQNDADKNEIETAALRGEIRALKKVLNLPESTAREVSRKAQFRAPISKTYAGY